MPVKIKCFMCEKKRLVPPSRKRVKNFCSNNCRLENNKACLPKFGAKTQIDAAFHKKYSSKAKRNLRIKISGNKHWLWKDKKVGYRGLHYWLKRKLGAPKTCAICLKKRNPKKPKSIHWANIDGIYKRDISKYISLCAKCHRSHDIKLRKKLKRATLYSPA